MRAGTSWPRPSRAAPRRDLLNMLKQNFKQVIHVKPASSRAESVEMFLLAKGFKGRQADADVTEA